MSLRYYRSSDSKISNQILHVFYPIEILSYGIFTLISLETGSKLSPQLYSCLFPNAPLKYNLIILMHVLPDTLSPAYNEHCDAKESARCSRVVVVTELVVAGILLVVLLVVCQ